jgi:hypothetical protein
MSETYLVRVPFAGIMSMEVEADDEPTAIQKALGVDVRMDLEEGDTDYGIEVEEWEIYKKTVDGNVNYTPLCYAEAVKR